MSNAQWASATYVVRVQDQLWRAIEQEAPASWQWPLVPLPHQAQPGELTRWSMYHQVRLQIRLSSELDTHSEMTDEGVGVRARLNLLEERMRGEAERERWGNARTITNPMQVQVQIQIQTQIQIQIKTWIQMWIQLQMQVQIHTCWSSTTWGINFIWFIYTLSTNSQDGNDGVGDCDSKGVVGWDGYEGWASILLIIIWNIYWKRESSWFVSSSQVPLLPGEVKSWALIQEEEGGDEIEGIKSFYFQQRSSEITLEIKLNNDL